MDITVNGKTEHTEAADVSTFVRDRGMAPAALVVELNGRVVASDRWADTPLREGDRLELLSFVGGG